MSFKKNLQTIYIRNFQEKNKDFNNKIEGLVYDALKEFNPKIIEEALTKKIEIEERSDTVRYSFKISLDSLINEDDKKATRVYYHDTFNQIETFIFNGRRYPSDNFHNYLFDIEPSIQILRKKLHEAFPEAVLFPWLYGFTLVIDITYYLVEDIIDLQKRDWGTIVWFSP